jgi:hypothetical protein
MVATRHETALTMHDRLHMPRSRGAFSGLLIVILGLWGGLVPFVGPSFGYSFTPDLSWHWTAGRLLLEIVPAVATILGGLAMMGSASRISGAAGAWLAAAGGAWFVTGQWFSMLWNHGVMQAGTPTATSSSGQVAEWLGFFLGLGVLIVFFGAVALGRMSVVGLKEVRVAQDRAATQEAQDAQDAQEAQDAQNGREAGAARDADAHRTPVSGRRVREDADRR